MVIMPDADAEGGDVVASDDRGGVDGRRAVEVLDDDTVAHARHDVVEDVDPRVVGDSDSLAEAADAVVDLVGGNLAARRLRPAGRDVRQPDRLLADVPDDVV